MRMVCPSEVGTPSSHNSICAADIRPTRRRIRASASDSQSLVFIIILQVEYLKRAVSA